MNAPYEGEEVLDRVAEGTATLEPLRKVLCSCQQLDSKTSLAKSGVKSGCTCKRAKAGPLK